MERISGIVKKIVSKICSQKGAAYAFLCLLIIAILPLLFVGFYDHPTGDDIYYGISAREVFSQTHSVLATLKDAFYGVAHDYQTWQGTYAAMFLMRLQPTVFSEGLYFLTPFLVILSLGFGTYTFISSIGKHVLKLSPVEILGTFSLFFFLCLQWVISPGEAFYWFNGSVYYSGFYGLLLCLWGLLCHYIFVGKKRTLVTIFLLEFLLGGSNYLTLLWSMILLCMLSFYLFLKKNAKKWPIFILTLCQIGFFIMSASAPGNQVRAASTVSLPAWKAVIFSLLQGFSFLGAWCNGWWLLGGLGLAIFLIPALWKMDFSFPCPMIVTFFLFGFFSALSCPTFYAQSNAGPARALNLSSYGFLLTSYIAVFYFCGYVLQKLKQRITLSENKPSHFAVTYAFFLLTLLVIQCGIGLQNDTLLLFSSVQAVRDIADGSVFAYEAEYQARLTTLQNAAGEDVVFLPYQNRPRTVLVGDYGQNPTQGSNAAMAKWYGVNSVIVDYSEQ